MKKYSEQIQRFGRSLLLPIGVMAPVGLLLGLSGAFTQSYMIELIPFLGNPTVKLIFMSIRQIADLIFANIPIMFAMGVAIGMAKKEKEVAALSGAIAFLIMHASIGAMININGGAESMLSGSTADAGSCHTPAAETGFSQGTSTAGAGLSGLWG